MAVFLATRIPSGLMVWWIGRDQPPYRALAPGEVIRTWRNPATYWHLIASWDGQWYQRAAEHGYPSHLTTFHGAVEQNPWAFYPLYPASVRAVMTTGLPFEIAASLVSLACGAAAMCLLYRMLMPTCGRFAATLTVLALCVYPASVTFQAAYTESMALLLILAGLWSLRARRYGVVLLLAVLLSLTRPVVLPLALVIGVHWVMRWRRREVEPFPRKEAVVAGLAAVGSALSFLIWPVVAAVVTGRPSAYADTRNAWDSAHAQGWPTWLVVFLGGENAGLRVLLVVALAVLVAVVARKGAALWGLELRTWAWAYPLFLVGATRPTSSIVRYAMLAAVPWWPVPEIGRTVVSPGRRVGLAALVLFFGLATQYLWIRWFFVITPASLSFP